MHSRYLKLSFHKFYLSLKVQNSGRADAGFFFRFDSSSMNLFVLPSRRSVTRYFSLNSTIKLRPMFVCFLICALLRSYENLVPDQNWKLPQNPWNQCYGKHCSNNNSCVSFWFWSFGNVYTFT